MCRKRPFTTHADRQPDGHPHHVCARRSRAGDRVTTFPAEAPTSPGPVPTVQDRTGQLAALGWTGRAAEWIALVALHSGVFTCSQWCYFSAARTAKRRACSSARSSTRSHPRACAGVRARARLDRLARKTQDEPNTRLAVRAQPCGVCDRRGVSRRTQNDATARRRSSHAPLASSMNARRSWATGGIAGTGSGGVATNSKGRLGNVPSAVWV